MLKLYKPQWVLTYLLFITIIAGEFTTLSAQWEGWNWRRTVTISNSTGSILTDFQVKVDLSNLTPAFDFSQANSDGSDLRVTSSDEVTQIPFWIEKWDAAAHQAVIWIKVPSVPATGTTIYLYYGNPLAASSSNGTNTFMFFDDFSSYDVGSGQNWVRRLLYSGGVWGPGIVDHDWKYSSEMQQGALYYSIERAKNGWTIESLDTQIGQEFDYIHSQLNPNGTVIADGSGFPEGEPMYCYGLILSNLSLGYMYFKTSNPSLSTRCYNDMVLVFNYLRVTYPTVGTVSDLGGNGWLLVGYSNAWKAFTDYGNATSASQAVTLVQSFTATFISNQAGSGSWNGANGVQEHLKRNFGMLKAYDVTGDASYLTAVKNNIDYILATFWIPSNGGLEWYADPGASNHFYECHQMWFMTAVRMLYDKSGGSYDYLTQGLAAWHFLTDNNYTNIDMYVNNYTNHNAFFSYRQITSSGAIQVDDWKGSYEIGTALWGMSLNYNWVSNYQSSHSDTAYNYLDMMVKQIKNSPSNRGFFNLGTLFPTSTLWSRIGNPNATIIQDDGNYALRSIGGASHTVYIASIDKSFSNFVFETKVKMSQDLNNQCTPEITFRYTNDSYKYFTMLRGEGLIGGGGPNGDLFIRKYYNGSPYINGIAAYNYTANQYYKFKIRANGNAIDLYLDDVLILSPTNAGGDVLTGGICLGNYGNNSYPVYYDDVRIRKYASVEPTSTVGIEEVNPLPVELNSFSASIISSTVKLNWITETEVNNYGFEIHRLCKDENLGWIKIGFVPGNGNSNSPKFYTFEDKNLSAGKYSYRLKQLDTDGQFEYSKVIELNIGSPMKFELSQNYPNPFNPVTVIQFSIPKAVEVNLTVYNILGEQVAELVNENKEAGVYTINFNAEELNSGLYIYKLTAGNFSDVKKLMVIK